MNGVVLRAMGTDLKDAFCAGYISENKKVVMSTKSLLERYIIQRYSCLLRGDKIIFQGRDGEVDNWNFDRNTHSLIWDSGVDPNGKVKDKEFYYQLYQLDQQKFDIIICKKFKNMGIGKALNDKLQRASYTEDQS
jgi:hypothetical protein